MNQASVEIQSLAAWLSTEEHRVQLGVWQFGYDILCSTYLWQHTQGSLGEHKVVCHLDIHRDVSLEFGL